MKENAPILIQIRSNFQFFDDSNIVLLYFDIIVRQNFHDLESIKINESYNWNEYWLQIQLIACQPFTIVADQQKPFSFSIFWSDERVRKCFFSWGCSSLNRTQNALNNIVSLYFITLNVTVVDCQVVLVSIYIFWTCWLVHLGLFRSFYFFNV